LHAILAAILVTSLVLAGSLCAVWLAVLLATLNVRGAPPLVEGSGGRALAVAAVIAVMAAAGVGARGRAYHQHRRKQQWRSQHGSRPR
jgi:hypothetical protein